MSGLEKLTVDTSCLLICLLDEFHWVGRSHQISFVCFTILNVGSAHVLFHWFAIANHKDCHFEFKNSEL